MSFDYEAVTWGGGELISAERPDFLDHGLHLQYALEAIRPISSGKIIEIGCGEGRFIASVAAARPELTAFGCDVSEAALVAARKRKGLQLGLASADRLPYADGQFAAVLMVDVLEHLDDIDGGLSEVRRVLEPGGVFHLVFPCEGNPLTLHGLVPGLHTLKRKYAGHIQRLSPWQILKRLSAHGLRPTAKRYSYHWLGQLYDAMVFGAFGLGMDMHRVRQTHVESGRRTWLRVVRAGVSNVLFLESKLLAHIPVGMTLHVTCQ